MAGRSSRSCATSPIAGDNAIFGQVGPQVGSFDAGFGVGLLARLVGDRKAKEIWFLCRRYDAAQALEMGLVNHVVPLADLEAEGVQWADEILAMSPTAIRFLKSAFLVATDGLAGMQEFAGNATGLYYTTDEAHEGSRAFLEKRRPDFSSLPATPVTEPAHGRPRPSLDVPDLAAGHPAGDPAGRAERRRRRARCGARGRDAVPARCRAGLPRGRVAPPDHGQPVQRPVRFPEGRRHARPDRTDPRRRGRAGDRAPARDRDRA